MTLNPEQKKVITNLATVYSRLTQTFDPDEVPISQYFTTENQNYVIEYGKMLEEIRGMLLTESALSGINEHDRLEAFHKEVDDIVIKARMNEKNNLKPWTFKFFKAWWTLQKLGKDTPLEHTARVSICEELENSKQISPERINKALDEVRASYISVFKKKRDEYLPKEFIKLGENVNGQKPKSFTTHHIIPSVDLRNFFGKYFENRKELGMQLVRKGVYDWYMIEEHNKRKSMIFNYRNLFLQQTNPETPRYTKLENNEEYKKFIDRICIVPLGLSFRGPTFRSDDPDKKFETTCEIIVGEEYKTKLMVLHKEILDFIEYCQPSGRTKKKYVPPTVIEKDIMGTKIYNRIFSIHLDGGKMFYHYNPNNWIHVENDIWKMGVNENRWFFINGEWTIKLLAQQRDTENLNIDFVPYALLPNLGSPVYDALRYDLKRRRRHHLSNITNIDFKDSSIEEFCKLTTATEKSPPERSFWCVKHPWFGLLPPIFLYCRLSGYY
jgi:hypothetical protein